MPDGAQDDPHLVGGNLQRIADAVRARIEGEAAVSAVCVEKSGERDGDPVVLALTEGLALAFTDTDDGVVLAVDPNLLAEGVLATHLVIDDVRPDKRDVHAARHFAGSKGAAALDVDVVDGGHLGSPAADADICGGMSAVDDGACGLGHGSSGGAGGAALRDCLIRVVFQILAFLVLGVLGVAEDHGRLLGGGEDIRTVAVDLGGDELVGARRQRDDHDDRGHTDDHTDEREDRPQLVRPERLQRDADGFSECHKVGLYRFYVPWSAPAIAKSSFSQKPALQ